MHEHCSRLVLLRGGALAARDAPTFSIARDAVATVHARARGASEASKRATCVVKVAHFVPVTDKQTNKQTHARTNKTNKQTNKGRSSHSLRSQQRNQLQRLRRKHRTTAHRHHLSGTESKLKQKRRGNSLCTIKNTCKAHTALIFQQPYCALQNSREKGGQKL
jgi:hypothetical protein